MLINYQCPKCGYAAQALGHLAGKTIRCPGCSASIRLPVAAKPAPMFPTQPIAPPMATALEDAQESPEINLLVEAAREWMELQGDMFAEMQRQGQQLEQISKNVGCIYMILAFWFTLSVIGFLAAMLL